MGRARKWGIAAVVATPFVLLLFLFMAAFAMFIVESPTSSYEQDCTPSDSSVQAAAEITAEGWTDEQLDIAGQIIGIGIARQFTELDIVLALMTSLQEAELKNLDFGDRDSLGPFQQRSSQGWGTPAQIMTPDYSINKFYDALAAVKEKQSLSPDDPSWLLETAIAVQRPSRAAYLSPFNYFPAWEDEARGLLAGSDSSGIVPVARAATDCTDSAADGQPVISTSGWVIPVSGDYRVTSRFGQRAGEFHRGLDLAAPIGTPIVSAAGGVVISAGPATGFGLWVRVQHDGGIVTVYGHNNRNLVGIGDPVQAGTQIAEVGNRGESTGPHLHFEVYELGKAADPATFLQDRGVTP